MSSFSFAELGSWPVSTLQHLPPTHLRNYTYEVSDKGLTNLLILVTPNYCH